MALANVELTNTFDEQRIILNEALALTQTRGLNSTHVVKLNSTDANSFVTLGGAYVDGKLVANTGLEANNGGIVVRGDSVIGTSGGTDTVVFHAKVNSNFVPEANGTISLGSSTLTFDDVFANGVVGSGTTLAIQVPAGTTAQQPAATTAALVRYNTETNYLEFSNGTSYTTVVPEQGGEIVDAVLKGTTTTINSTSLVIQSDTGLTGDLQVSGNLTVTGTTTYVNTTVLEVADKNVDLNKGGTTAGTTGSGITILGDSDAAVGYIRTGASDNTLFELQAPGSTNKILTVNTASNTTFTVSANLTVESTSVVNQDLTTDADVTFNKLTAGSANLATVTTTSGDLTLTSGDANVVIGTVLEVESGATVNGTVLVVGTDSYVSLTDHTTAPGDTANKLYSNTSGLYWEDTKLDAAQSEPYVEQDTTTNSDRFITFVDSSTAGNQRLNVDTTGPLYNPSTGKLTSTSFGGTFTGMTASRALVSDASGNITSSAVTATEVGYLDGVTSAIQTQLNAKQATITGAATTIDTEDLTASRALVSDGSGKVAVSAVTATEVGYLDGVTSNIQTQIDSISGGITTGKAIAMAMVFG